MILSISDDGNAIVKIFDWPSQTWSTKASMSQPRKFGACGVYTHDNGKKEVVIAGGIGKGSGGSE